MKVKIKPERENFQIPKKGSEKAACYDAYVAKIEYLDDGLVKCYLGFSTEIETGYKGLIIPRSNISKFGWCLTNSIGVIDEDYRGEWIACFRSLPWLTKETITIGNEEKTFTHTNSTKFLYKEGDRVCQICFEKVYEPEFDVVEVIDETKRGEGGFGSSGLK